jgi:hypothetical protein
MHSTASVGNYSKTNHPPHEEARIFHSLPTTASGRGGYARTVCSGLLPQARPRVTPALFRVRRFTFEPRTTTKLGRHDRCSSRTRRPLATASISRALLTTRRCWKARRALPVSSPMNRNDALTPAQAGPFPALTSSVAERGLSDPLVAPPPKRAPRALRRRLRTTPISVAPREPGSPSESTHPSEPLEISALFFDLDASPKVVGIAPRTRCREPPVTPSTSPRRDPFRLRAPILVESGQGFFSAAISTA